MYEKQKALAHIAKEIEVCTICHRSTSGRAVVGEGNLNSSIVFVGEAPGKEESKTGRPFVGRSGTFLRKQMERIGINPQEVYITSPVKYLPDKKTPTLAQITHGAMHLQKQLEVIKPKLIVLMGVTAVRALLVSPISITKQHGQVVYENGKTYFITFHPAAAIRFLPTRKLFEEDFVLLGKFIQMSL